MGLGVHTESGPLTPSALSSAGTSDELAPPGTAKFASSLNFGDDSKWSARSSVAHLPHSSTHSGDTFYLPHQESGSVHLDHMKRILTQAEELPETNLERYHSRTSSRLSSGTAGHDGRIYGISGASSSSAPDHASS